MNGLIALQGLGLALCLIGAVIGLPSTLDLTFGSTNFDHSGAVRSQRRGALLFLLGAAIGFLPLLVQSRGGVA